MTILQKDALNFKQISTSMINSILNRHKDPVKFENIKTPNDIITEPQLIKSHIQQHFDQWTAYRPINQQIFETHWSNEYLPNRILILIGILKLLMKLL